MAKATGGCGPQAIWDALINAGFSTPQAIGAMANGMAESKLQPETRAMDTNGYYSNGIWQFNEGTYPDSSSLITGDCAKDIDAQVGYLASHIGGSALVGRSGAEVAGNFAANFERCTTCQSGGESYTQRVANASTVQGWVDSGNWPASAGNATLLAAQAASGGQSGDEATCLISVGGMHIGLVLGHGPSLPKWCLLSKSEGRAVLGALLMVAGFVIIIPGIGLVLIDVGTRAIPAVTDSVSKTGRAVSYFSPATGAKLQSAASTARRGRRPAPAPGAGGE